MNKLRAYRKKVGLSQAALAKKLGVTQNHISNLEHGCRGPSLLLAERISRVTKNAVPASSWVDLSDNDQIEPPKGAA